jgi:hypothetical protein
MKLTVFKAGFLAAAFALMLTACGGVQSPTKPNTTDQSIRTFVAGNETTITTGITQWRKSIAESGAATNRVVIEGNDSAGTLVATITVQQDNDTTAVEITGKFPAKVVASPESETNELEAVISNPVFAGYRRDFEKTDVSGVSQNPQAQRTTRALTASARATYRQGLQCRQAFAAFAYRRVNEIRSSQPCLNSTYRLDLEMSNDVTKVWQETGTFHWVIGFAGTRIKNAGDIARDIESAFGSQTRQSAVSGVKNPPGLIKNGFWNRWSNQASRNQFANRLNRWADQLSVLQISNPNARMDIDIVGHSLGAAAATIGAIDIAGWRNLDRGGTVGSILNPRAVRNLFINAYVFNPPRTGNAEYARIYAQTIADQTNSLRLYEFTVSFDPVQSANLDGWHPFYNSRDNDSFLNGADQPAPSLNMGYCPQYNVTRNTFNPFANHSLGLWVQDIQNMPDSHIDCMNGEIAVTPPTSIFRYVIGSFETGGGKWISEVRQEIKQIRDFSGNPVNDATQEWPLSYCIHFQGDDRSDFFKNSINRNKGNLKLFFEGRDPVDVNRGKDFAVQDQRWHTVPDFTGNHNLINRSEYKLDARGSRDLTITGTEVSTTSTCQP